MHPPLGNSTTEADRPARRGLLFFSVAVAVQRLASNTGNPVQRTMHRGVFVRQRYRIRKRSPASREFLARTNRGTERTQRRCSSFFEQLGSMVNERHPVDWTIQFLGRSCARTAASTYPNVTDDYRARRNGGVPHPL